MPTFEATFTALSDELMAYFRKRLPNPQDAEDYVQQTFELVLMREAESIENLARLIAKGLLTDEYRRRAPSTVSWEDLRDSGYLDELEQFHELTIEEAMFDRAFDLAVRELSEDERDAFILGELRGVPSREASLLLGSSQRTIVRRREAATDSIRKELTPYG